MRRRGARYRGAWAARWDPHGARNLSTQGLRTRAALLSGMSAPAKHMAMPCKAAAYKHTGAPCCLLLMVGRLSACTTLDKPPLCSRTPPLGSLKRCPSARPARPPRHLLAGRSARRRHRDRGDLVAATERLVEVRWKGRPWREKEKW